ncbi:MAG: hypothetical protein B6I35_13810 [Anaerolineaceae bacterium 4572_32.2]|nr:MAG: hypothetical protein B6I35_13810 [Anaerolineaceae bacterium 4572_32.2]
MSEWRIANGEWASLAGLLLVGCLTLGIFALTADRTTDGQGGVPLDDAWIHFQFARNLARGDGLSFNPGHPTSGSTAPLWTLLLAGAYFVGGDFPIAGQVLSAACFLAALAATYALGRQLTGNHWAGWLAGAVVAVNGRMVWAGLSALETCLFAALSLLAISAYLNDRAAHRYRLRTAALFGLAALSRPEGYLLFALSLLDSTILRISRLKFDVLHFTSCVLHLFLPIALFTAIVLPYLIFSLHTSGHLLPNTYHAKAVVNLLPSRDFLSLAARHLILDNPLLLPFYLLGLILLIERAPLLSLWSAGLPLAYAFLHAALYQHGRYLIPLIPCNAVLGVVGLLEARKLARRRGCRWRERETRFFGKNLVSVLLILVGTGWQLPAMARQYSLNVTEINRMHVALGRWAAEHTPPGATLALNDIGAIAYLSERPVVDLAGLITPEVVPLLRSPNRDALLADFLIEQNVDYAIIFPNWFPDLAARDDILEELHRVTLEQRTIAGGETMVVYQVHR